MLLTCRSAASAGLLSRTLPVLRSAPPLAVGLRAGCCSSRNSCTIDGQEAVPIGTAPYGEPGRCREGWGAKHWQFGCRIASPCHPPAEIADCCRQPRLQPASLQHRPPPPTGMLCSQRCLAASPLAVERDSRPTAARRLLVRAYQTAEEAQPAAERAAKPRAPRKSGPKKAAKPKINVIKKSRWGSASAGKLQGHVQ